MPAAVTQLLANNSSTFRPRRNMEQEIIEDHVDKKYKFYERPKKYYAFGSTIQYRVGRQGDLTKDFCLKVNVPDLPEGTEYKQFLPLRLIKECSLDFGEESLLLFTQEQKMLEHFIQKHSMYSDTIFMNNSQNEYIIPLFNLFEMPLIRLVFQNITFKIKFSPLEHLIQGNPIKNPSTFFLVYPKIIAVYSFLDSSERRELVKREQTETYFQHNSTHFDSYELSENSLTFIPSITNQPSSATYFHILDMSGNEIPFECVKEIKLLVDGVVRHSISSIVSKTMMRSLLPHPTRDTPLSQNIYYLSHTTPGSTYEENNMETGIHYNLYKNVSVTFTFSPETPINIRIVTMNRTFNGFRSAKGMGDFSFPIS